MTSGILAGIERWPLDQLISYVRNARTHSEDQVAQIAASIIGVSNRSQLENKHKFFADSRGRIGQYQRIEMNRVEKRKHPLLGLLTAGVCDAVSIRPARAQQAPMPVVGFVRVTAPEDST
jgi:hypothetical protein